MIMIINLVFNFGNFSVIICFLTRPLVLGSLFSNSDLSVLYLVFKTNQLVSILFTLATSLSYSVFLTIPFFTASLSLLKLTRTGYFLQLIYQYLIYQLQFLNQLNLFLKQNLKYQHA